MSDESEGCSLIYILEDDESIRKLVTYALSSQNLEAQGFACPSEFWAAMAQQQPELRLLDIMLPEEDGLSILKKLREAPATKHLPIIMLTAKGTEYDKVVGLDTGADDYIAKPFGMMELVSRIKAVLRRVGEKTEAPLSQIDGLTVDQQRHLVSVDGEPVALTLKEFALLCELLSANGTVLSRDVLLNRVWGYDYTGESRTVDVHVGTLRQKLGRIGEHIETVRGVGYRIQ